MILVGFCFLCAYASSFAYIRGFVFGFLHWIQVIPTLRRGFRFKNDPFNTSRIRLLEKKCMTRKRKNYYQTYLIVQNETRYPAGPYRNVGYTLRYDIVCQVKIPHLWIYTLQNTNLGNLHILRFLVPELVQGNCCSGIDRRRYQDILSGTLGYVLHLAFSLLSL